MKKNSNGLIISGAVISLLSLFIFGCNEINISSKWRTQEIKIDGKNTEWKSGNYIKDANVLVNICNDEEYVYLSIASNDRNLPMLVMRGGLTIWFDPTGEGEKTFGIKFPAGMNNMEMPKDNEQFDPSKAGDQNSKMAMPKMEFNQCEILNEEGESEAIMSLAESKRIQIKMSDPQDKFFLEMKVPLKATDDFLYAINADTSKMISIGFATASDDKDKMSGGQGMGPGGGGAPPSGGGAPPSGGGPGGGGGPSGGGPGGGRGPGGGQGKASDSSNKLDFWLSVQLSSKDSK